MIVTCKKKVPFSWIFTTVSPWGGVVFQNCVMGFAFLFSMKKFVENPAGITFVLSLPSLVSLVLAPTVSFMSDRVWTRFGRRKPFVTAAWVGTGSALLMMPLMPNFWALLGAFLLYSVCNDFSAPAETLMQEVVPPHQRGRAMAILSWMRQFGILVFFFVGIGRFDDYGFMAGFPFTGERAIYWVAGTGMLVVAVMVMLGIKELDQKSALRGEKLSVKNFFGGILNANLWPVYILIFASAMMEAGLGVMGNLLYTDQWGFTKQDMGNNVAIGGVINLFLIVFLGVFADRWNRMKAYQVLIVLGLITNMGFFLYVHLAIYDQRPSLLEIVTFGEALAIIGLLKSMTYGPLVYDYVPRNEMGTYLAGATLLNRAIGFITLNGVGLFIWGYAALFLPPGGDSVRLVLKDPQRADEVRAMLGTGAIMNSATGQPILPGQISAATWYATGAALDSGRCFEVRLDNPESVRLQEEREKLSHEREAESAKASFNRDRALAAEQRGRTAHAEKMRQAAATGATHVAALDAKITSIDTQLASSSDSFTQAVLPAFREQLLPEGAEILSATKSQGTLLTFPLVRRPSVSAQEKTLDALRSLWPAVIDLRPVLLGSGYGLQLSVAGTDAALIKSVKEALLAEAARRMPGILDSAPPQEKQTSVISLNLLIVEDPLDRHPSPITRVVNAVLAQFDAAPREERRLGALARSLRASVPSGHAGMNATGDRSLAVTVVLDAANPPPPVAQDAVSARLTELLGNTPDDAARARSIYDIVVRNSPSQRITVARPIVRSGFIKRKYDYMSGYLWMFCLGTVGLFITFAFCARERRGLIHKRGLEESEMS
jgi:Na+/melibiose symporter-like transporter